MSNQHVISAGLWIFWEFRLSTFGLTGTRLYWVHSSRLLTHSGAEINLINFLELEFLLLETSIYAAQFSSLLHAHGAALCDRAGLRASQASVRKGARRLALLGWLLAKKLNNLGIYLVRNWPVGARKQRTLANIQRGCPWCCELAKGIGSQVEVISMKRCEQQSFRVCEASWLV